MGRGTGEVGVHTFVHRFTLYLLKEGVVGQTCNVLNWNSNFHTEGTHGAGVDSLGVANKRRGGVLQLGVTIGCSLVVHVLGHTRGLHYRGRDIVPDSGVLLLSVFFGYSTIGVFRSSVLRFFTRTSVVGLGGVKIEGRNSYLTFVFGTPCGFNVI